MVTIEALDKGKKVGAIFITCQTKCVWVSFQCNKIGSKLFVGTISMG